MRKLPAFVAVGLLCAGAIAFAQTTPLYNLIGTETVVVTLGSGSSITIPINQIRNTSGVSPIGTGTTVNSSPSGTVGHLVATGAITTWNVTLPNPAYNGQRLFLVGDNAVITTANVTASTGTQTQTLNTAFSTTLQPSSPVGWIYYSTGSKWYRIQ